MVSGISAKEFEKALATLKEAISFADSFQIGSVEYRIARDACIQRFEYCIELSWKVSMKLLGSTTKFAKPAIREMARGDLIDSAETWLGFIEARNDSSHSYDEEVAAKVFAQIQAFVPEADKLAVRLPKA